MFKVTHISEFPTLNHILTFYLLFSPLLSSSLLFSLLVGRQGASVIVAVEDRCSVTFYVGDSIVSLYMAVGANAQRWIVTGKHQDSNHLPRLPGSRSLPIQPDSGLLLRDCQSGSADLSNPI